MPHRDAHWMRHALRLARRHAGRTWPNPTVGACVVGDGRLLAEGAHLGAGEDHAEVVALAALERTGIDPGRLTLYVTLEPCHHQGRTPPCTRRILETGIGRVVYAVADTNPHVRGGGGDWLRAQGVQVESGLLAAQAWELNHPFLETGGAATPHVTLKLAVSADGRLARRRGRVADAARRRISGPVAQRRVHRMRSAASCVVVGRRTVQHDRPRLTARGVDCTGQPRAVVLDGDLQVPPGELPAHALIFSRSRGDASRARELESAGHEVVAVEADDRGRLQWEAILAELQRRDLGVVLVEGGAEVAASLLSANLAHRIHLFLAPRWLGGDGPPLSVYGGREHEYRTHRVRRRGPDVEWVMRRRDLPAPPV